MSETPKTMDYWVAQQIVSAAAVGENKGAIAERERIIKLLKETFGTLGIQMQVGSYIFATDLETLIKGEQK